ncbi:MAG: 6-phosphofructokinase [Chloroflexi bacterium]|nr:6-phosphofructokinase [Chloroflexota bacterium]
MKPLAILTGGGDAPGLNAVIRAAVKTALLQYQVPVLGVRNGLNGFIDANGVFPLDLEAVRGILPRGGTILGAANRGNPFLREVIKDGHTTIEDQHQAIFDGIKALDLSGLLVVGGDGSLHIALELYRAGVPVIGVPKTIDNDIGGTDFTFGFDTALNCAMEAIDRLHTTAEAHHRVMILELMGRNAGFIALHAGIAGGADVILIPEIPFRFESICAKVRQRIERGTRFSIIAVAEGAHPQGQQPVYASRGDQVKQAHLGGIGQRVSDYLNQTCGIESRVIVLGHLQRGGSPSAFDRWLATGFGSLAVRLAIEGHFGVMTALRGDQIIPVPLVEALATPKRVDLQGESLATARRIGISLGDEE